MAARKETEKNHNGCGWLCDHGADAIPDRGDGDNIAEDMGSI